MLKNLTVIDLTIWFIDVMVKSPRVSPPKADCSGNENKDNTLHSINIHFLVYIFLANVPTGKAIPRGVLGEFWGNSGAALRGGSGGVLRSSGAVLGT